MAGASNIQWCEPCGRDGENQQAYSWCSDCSEPLCKECLKFHRKGKTTANHKTIPILKAEKLGSLVLNIPDTCHIHDDQKLSFFCIHHDKICCAFCLRESHSTCKDVKSIEQASKGVKMGTAIDDVQHRISEFSFMISKILDVYKNNLSSLSDQKAEYKGKIKNYRKELNSFLDTLEQETDTKFDACNKECKSEIEKNINDLTTRQKKSESRQTAIETLKEHASETKIFTAVKTIDLLLIEEEVCLSKMQENLTSYALRSSPCDLIEKIKPILAILSEIKIEKIKSTVVKLPLKVQQVRAYKIQQERPRLLHKISCSTIPVRIYDIACLTTDNRIVFSEQPICVYDIASSIVHTIQTDFYANAITCDLKNNIYGAFSPIYLMKIDIEKMQLGADLSKEKPEIIPSSYICIRVNDEKLYSNYGNEIIVFNQNGTVLKSFKAECRPAFMCVENSGGIFISNGRLIILMTETGPSNYIPTSINSDDKITGLDVDKQGQLYACICKKEAGSIVRINTTTGYKEPVLENLVTPENICFHPTRNTFLVITDHGKECSVYEVTK